MRTAIGTIMSGAFVATTALVMGGAPPAGAAAPVVVINELNYHPEDDDPANEFIELFNTTGSAISLAGWCIDGIDYCFPGGSSIPANGFVVRDGTQYEGKLSNGGEDISLFDNGGALIDFVEYDDKREWPSLADGDGHSIQRRDPAADSESPGNWESHAPTRGAPNAVIAAGLLPVFEEVEHTMLPAAGVPVEVSAELSNASSATLFYKIGFGGEVAVPMTISDGVVAASIPGQAAGTLIRYRLSATNGGRTNGAPRQGDGANYLGTTVARSVDTQLPVFEIFMPDDEFDVMREDITLRGDNGYPMVFAYEGQVFDNARIRVKGQVSRYYPKKKFKIILPPGYDLEDDELFPDDVDEWGMHASWPDKSFLRETLASEFMIGAGAKAQQAFPVRFERNNQFLGLYTYVEQPDGTYRDRYGLDDSEVYEVGPDNIFGLLDARDATRSQSSLRARYDKETFEYLGDDELRRFIHTVNSLSGVSERDWIYDNVDIPSVVNILAGSMVIQNQDWGHKNYRLVFDQYGRAGIAQNDYDLTYGRRWSNEFGGTDSRVYVGGAYEHPGGPFFFTFFADPELNDMVKRRVRTLAEELMHPDQMQTRVNELVDQIRPEALADRQVWGTYGSQADPAAEAQRLMDSFVRPQYDRLLGSFARSGRVASNPQPAIPNVRIEEVNYGDVEWLTIRNNSGDTVDISGFEIPEIEYTVPGGTVLLPGRAAVLAHEDIETLRAQFTGLLVLSVFEESVNDAEDGLTLLNRNGDEVSGWSYLPPEQMTQIKGEADRSAIVSLIAADSRAPGLLQLLPCDADPGATSNVNVDGVGQYRSTISVANFDTDGEACIFNLSAMHVIADVQGYFADGALDDIDDARLIDTRNGPTPTAGTITKITGGRANSTGIASLVVTETESPGFLAVLPCSATSPATSNLNWTGADTTIAALTFIEFDDNGEACVFQHSAAHFLADVQAYFTDGSFDDIVDERLVDTRGGAMPAGGSLTKITGQPDSIGVVSLVATATSAPGYLQVVACDATPGETSNVNFAAGGLTVNGLATVPFDSNGEACIYALSSTHVVADLQGYFADGAFEDVPDKRLVDTRE